MVLTRSAKKLVSAKVHETMQTNPKGSVKSEPVKLVLEDTGSELCPPQLSAPLYATVSQLPPLQPSALQPLAAPITSKVQVPNAPRDQHRSSCSTASSILARRKRLELQAAKEKARIEMELIDKRLEADLADLEDEYSPLKGGSEIQGTRTDVEKWLDKSQHEMATVQPAPANGSTTGELNPLNGTVEMLATALKQITTSAAQNRPDTQLLSRMSVPKDLPDFYGDPLEWLQFKQAYDESTKICGFSDMENVWRLRKCLKGAAKEAVAALLITAISPDQLLSTLQLRFGNPDYIIFKITQELKKLHSLPTDYQSEIVPFSIKIQNFVSAVRAVNRDECLRGSHLSNIILSKFPTILISKWSDYSFPLLKDGNYTSRIDIISDFLREEALKMSVTANINMHSVMRSYSQTKYKQQDYNIKNSHTVLMQYPEDSNNNCRFCDRNKHELPSCKQFLKALRKDRWRHVKRHGLCYKCLISRHDRESCPAPACDKPQCGGAHHRLLHNPPRRDDNRPSSSVQETNPTPSTSTETVAHMSVVDKVMLKVVPVLIHGPNGVFSASALLDDGSTVSLISARLAARVGLSGHTTTMRVRGAWNDNILECNSTIVNVKLSSLQCNNDLYTVSMRSVKELNLPVQNIPISICKDYNHLKNVKFYCNYVSKPEILIGMDNYSLLIPLEICVGNNNEPSATKTPLGWSVHGVIRGPHSNAGPAPHAASLLIAQEDESASDRTLRNLHEEVRRSFSIDALGVAGKPRENRCEIRAVDMLEKDSQLVNGRWIVGLPWKNPLCKLPNNYLSATSRFQSVERKMSASFDYACKYKDRIDHLLSNNFARLLENTKPSIRTWYLPHFGVQNPNKKKLRLVFDAAAKVNGVSLNDNLLTGPDLLNSLLGIMFRFRENRIGVTGDIKDMFLQIKIKPEDQDSLRFLWRDKPADNIKTYVMSSLIFGANCSPFIAQFIKNKNALRYESSQPAAVAAICKQHYVDDYIDSIPDEDTAIDMVRNIINIHKKGGFEIRNWTSNSAAVLNSVPKEALGDTAVRFKTDQQHQGERTLGMIWFPVKDELGFDVSFKRIPDSIMHGKEKPTKRLMLAVVMSIFDVFGFLAPFTVEGKVMLQDTWKENINWDDMISDPIYVKWRNWLKLLNDVKDIRIPRCYLGTQARTGTLPTTATAQELRDPTTCESDVKLRVTNRATASKFATEGNYNNLQLHIFSDASSKAMCTVAYWRWISNGTVCIAFIASKGRVAPVKPVTIPRLELQAALLAARLADNITREHKIETGERYFWCDSTTVLQWIYNDARNYGTFVANRLGEIDELTQMKEWRYVPTKLNIADIGTREISDIGILTGEWFRGPSFLYECESTWPRRDIKLSAGEDMECINLVQGDMFDLPVPDADRFSSWLRLLRAAAVVLKFIKKCRKEKTTGILADIEKAERLLIKKAQTDSFAADIAEIKKGRCVERTSKLLTLSPFLDDHGVLRCGGRINAATGIQPDTKHPIILEGKHQVARLIVKHYHEKAAHGNQELVVNNLKQKYWIIKLRPTVKSVASRCMTCRIRKCKPQMPRMGDLPGARVAHHQRPFTHCGVDLFGPMSVTVGRRHEKRYGVLFTCLTVRAIHLEIVHSVTTDSFIMALRRMAVRRGWPRHLWSDNGTNLRGADTELKKSIQEISEEDLRIEAANNAADWTFIPPASPHWGGAWERLIRSVKSSLKIILKERAPKDEVLNTLMTEVENIVNSRPLSHVSVEPSSNETLTPNHFLLGASSNLPIPGEFDDSALYLRKLWRQSQRLADMFWKRWVREILPDLVPRRKWNQEGNILKVGDLVLVVDPGAPRNVWQKAVVQEIFPGADGRVRLVEVRTKTGVLRRSAARLARIPMVEEC